jgi:histidine decarboxylase
MNIVLPVNAVDLIHRSQDRFDAIRKRVAEAHSTHLGYPYNLNGLTDVPVGLRGYLINNLGDPYTGSHYGSEVCDLERESMDWLMNLWECGDHADYWGSIGASGTEGNFWALYLAREALPGAKLIYTREAHYSIPKAAKILRMEALCVECSASGAVDLEEFTTAIGQLADASVIVALTCGTTVKGAHDDIAAVVEILDHAGYGRDRRYVHVDGALNAMVLPFADGVPAAIKPTFRHGIDSISTSGHKMIGTPMPCGALVARRQHVERIASSVAYLRSNDTTLMGSRNGHAVLAIWSRLFGHGAHGYRADVRRCLDLTEYLCGKLRSANIPLLCNPSSITVLFPQPSEPIVNTYQLACSRGDAHAIVMPNVTQTLIDNFVRDYTAWWEERSFDSATSGARS